MQIVSFQEFKTKTTISRETKPGETPLVSTHEIDDVRDGVCTAVRTKLENTGKGTCVKCDKRICVVNFPNKISE